MSKVKYRVITTNTPVPKSTLDAYGQDGWQLVSILRHSDQIHSYFSKVQPTVDVDELVNEIKGLKELINDLTNVDNTVEDSNSGEKRRGRPPKAE